MALQGVVKTYDPTTGIGVVIREDDETEVFLHPGSLEGSIFRFVRQGQRILFDLDDAGRFISNVKVGQEGY